MMTNIRKHHCPTSNPGTFTDSPGCPHAWLLSNGTSQIGRAVRIGTARYLHGGADQDVALDVDKAEVTARANVHIHSQPGSCLAENCAEFDRGASVARREDASEKCPSKV